MVEKHNTIITINCPALSFANRAASLVTTRFAYDKHYAPLTSAAGMGSRQHRERGRGNVRGDMRGDPGRLNGAIYWGGERTGESDCQGVEVPGPVVFSHTKFQPRIMKPNTRR